MYWSYPGPSNTVVPSTSLYYPTYVSNSPFNVTVVWPPYYTEIITGLIPQCVYLWGNGNRDGDEQWDDKNTFNEDGWSSIWMVEDGYACTKNSTTNEDVWKKFDFTSTSNQSSSSSNTSSGSSSSPSSTTTSTSKQRVYTISGSNEWLALILWLSVLLWLILDVIIGAISDLYPAGVYVSIEHIQLLSILPITGSYFTKIVNGLFRLMRFSLLGFDFINIKSLLNITWDFSQTNDTLDYLGFESGSGFVNIFAFILVELWILFMESILYRIVRFFNWKLTWWAKLRRVSLNFRNWICVGFFIRYIILGYPLILISCITEVKKFSNSNYLWSWWISTSILIFWIIIFIVSLSNWLWTTDEEQQSGLLSEFTNALKPNVYAKSFIPLFLFHRILIWTIVWALSWLSLQAKIISLIWTQGIYIILMLLIWPYSQIKANISKIICEASVLSIIVLMLVYQDSSEWDNSTEKVFLYLMTASSWVPWFITTSKHFYNF